MGHFPTSYNDSLFLEKVAFKLQCGLPHCKLDFWLVSSRLGLLKAQILTVGAQVLLLILNISTYSLKKKHLFYLFGRGQKFLCLGARAEVRGPLACLLPLLHVSPGSQTLAVRISGKLSYLMGHLTGSSGGVLAVACSLLSQTLDFWSDPSPFCSRHSCDSSCSAPFAVSSHTQRASLSRKLLPGYWMLFSSKT